MKRLITLLIGLLIVVSSSYATCIEILNFHWEYCSVGHYKAVVVYTNNTGSNRSFKVKVYGANNEVCFSDCVTALQGNRTYTSQIFSCCDPVNMSVKTYTGHNCNGQVCEYISLPITLGYFNATRKNNNSVILKWGTETESNNDRFVILRKTDNDFVEIASIPSKALGGNSSTRIEYQYVDNSNFYSGMSLYRLKQLDKDGMANFTDIILVSKSKSVNQSEIKISPNPARAGSIINVIFPSTQKHSLILYSINGGEVYRWDNISGNDFKLPDLPPGIYFLKPVSNTELKTQKVIIF